MRIPAYFLGGLLLLASSASVVAQGKPDQPAAAPAAAADEVTQKAMALTKAQIKQSSDISGLTRLASIYDQQGDLDRFGFTLERLVELLPNSGELKLQLAMVYALQEDKAAAYDQLVKMQTQGFGFDIAQDPRFEPIHGTRVWDYIVTNLQVNAKQFGEGKVALTIPKGDHLIESIGYDPKRKQFLLGGAREGKVYLADNSGKLSDFISANAENGMWAVYDLAVDAAHDKLYVASSGVPYFKGFNADAFGKAGVFEFTLSTGKFQHKYILPQDGTHHILSSLAVSKDGKVYAADGVNRQIFHIDGGALKLLIGDNKLTSIRGMAVSADGKTLYFADSALGMFGIDLTKTAPFALGYNPEKLVLGGITGVYAFDGTLIVIESGMVPQRVMRLQLDKDGRNIESVMPLDVAQPAFASPTFGVLVDDSLYFVANSEKSLYDDYGVLTDASKLKPVSIFRSNARFAWGQNGIGAGLSSVPQGKSGDTKQIVNSPVYKPAPKAKPKGTDTAPPNPNPLKD